MTRLGDWFHVPQVSAIKAHGACPSVESSAAMRGIFTCMFLSLEFVKITNLEINFYKTTYV